MGVARLAGFLSKLEGAVLEFASFKEFFEYFRKSRGYSKTQLLNFGVDLNYLIFRTSSSYEQSEGFIGLFNLYSIFRQNYITMIAASDSIVAPFQKNKIRTDRKTKRINDIKKNEELKNIIMTKNIEPFISKDKEFNEKETSIKKLDIEKNNDIANKKLLKDTSINNKIKDVLYRYYTYLQKRKNITNNDKAKYLKLIELLNIPYYLAPCGTEADDVLTHTDYKNLTHCNYTGDMDYLVRGCKCIFYTINKKVYVYEIDRILKALKFKNHDQFILFCSLLRTDFIQLFGETNLLNTQALYQMVLTFNFEDLFNTSKLDLAASKLNTILIMLKKYNKVECESLKMNLNDIELFINMICELSKIIKNRDLLIQNKIKEQQMLLHKDLKKNDEKLYYEQVPDYKFVNSNVSKLELESTIEFPPLEVHNKTLYIQNISAPIPISIKEEVLNHIKYMKNSKKRAVVATNNFYKKIVKNLKEIDTNTLIDFFKNSTVRIINETEIENIKIAINFINISSTIITEN